MSYKKLKDLFEEQSLINDIRKWQRKILLDIGNFRVVIVLE